jgi:NTP pyrophosphatase (non-canonical NTP hydrolase)
MATTAQTGYAQIGQLPTIHATFRQLCAGLDEHFLSWRQCLVAPHVPVIVSVRAPETFGAWADEIVASPGQADGWPRIDFMRAILKLTSVDDCIDGDTLLNALSDASRHVLLFDAEHALRRDASHADRLTFKEFRAVNRERCMRWHPNGIQSWSDSDWIVAIVGELGELASLIKMRNRERDGLTGNKFSPTDEQIANEAADVFTYLDLFCERNGIDLGAAAARKFNEVSERNDFPERIRVG